MVATGLMLCTVLAAQSDDSLPPAAARALTDVRYLAADERDGRGAGTDGLEAASRYIAAEFRRAGWKPAAGGSFFQPFTIPADAPVGLQAGDVITAIEAKI